MKRMSRIVTGVAAILGATAVAGLTSFPAHASAPDSYAYNVRGVSASGETQHCSSNTADELTCVGTYVSAGETVTLSDGRAVSNQVFVRQVTETWNSDRTRLSSFKVREGTASGPAVQLTIDGGLASGAVKAASVNYLECSITPDTDGTCLRKTDGTLDIRWDGTGSLENYATPLTHRFGDVVIATSGLHSERRAVTSGTVFGDTLLATSSRWGYLMKSHHVQHEIVTGSGT